MAFNGSGLFVRLFNWVDDAANAIDITDTRMDDEFDGIVDGLSNSICRDGQSTTTAKIPLAVGASIGDGSVGTPALNWISDTDCGPYRIGANNIGWAIAGAKVLDISATGLVITGSLSQTGAILPATNDAAALGSATLMWSDLFLASGGVINWNNGDVLATHSANTLAFSGASSGYTFDAVIKPSANDGLALGVSGTAFSDLFLADGAVINFNAGNYTITHSAGVLTLNGAFSIGTSNALTAGTIELGAASDTTLARSAAGVMMVEGVPLYPGIPINDQSAAYGLLIGDAQKAIRHPAADNNARTFTIPANGSVAYPVGTCITFINEINTVTIAITTDTLVLSPGGTTGSRSLAANGIATAIKVSSTRWYISGTGLT